jgi:hypothetical protein
MLSSGRGVTGKLAPTISSAMTRYLDIIEEHFTPGAHRNPNIDC